MRTMMISVAVFFFSMPIGLAAPDAKSEAVGPVMPNVDMTKAPTAGEVIDGVTGVVKAAKMLVSGKDDTGERVQKLLGIAALLAALFKLLLSILKLVWGWLKTNAGKNVVKLISLCLGLATYYVSTLALGKDWWEALILALSGPGAMIFHEITKVIPDIRKMKNPKEEPKKEPKNG